MVTKDFEHAQMCPLLFKRYKLKFTTAKNYKKES